jgi:phosphatidylserine/phosphatidylglycerophosphate/cardiolipin synthase-like enzyme
LAPTGDPWPSHIEPDFLATEIGIARTLPASDEMDEVREIEAQFLDGIDQATRTIYIENQFITSRRIAERLAKRLAERPALEAVIIVPQGLHSWLESQAMASGRSRFIAALRAAGVRDRVAVLSPHVSNGAKDIDVMVHSKLMVIDDVLLHVGSANLNNRSIGLDTECDLAIEGSTQGERRAIERLRNRLQAWMQKNRQPGKDGAEFEEGVAASQRTFDDAEHATLLARDEDAVRIGRAVAEGRACSVDAPYPI